MPSFQYGPCGDGAMRHFGVPSGLVTLPGFSIEAVNALYQKICWAILPCAGTGPASLNVIPEASGGANFFSQSMYLVVANTAAGLFVPPPRETDAPTAWQPSGVTRTPHSSTGMPFGMPLSASPAIDSHASVKRHP